MKSKMICLLISIVAFGCGKDIGPYPTGINNKPTSETSETTETTEILEIREGYGVDSMLVQRGDVVEWVESRYKPNPNYIPTYPSLEYENMKNDYINNGE